MYAPQLGRFVSRDPLGYQDGASQLQYAGGEPNTGRDPSGMMTTTVRCKCKCAHYCNGYRQGDTFDEGTTITPGAGQYGETTIKALCTRACEARTRDDLHPAGPKTVCWYHDWETGDAISDPDPTFGDEYTKCSKSECQSGCNNMVAVCVGYCNVACAPLKLLGTPYWNCVGTCTTPCWSGWAACHGSCLRCRWI